MDSRFLDTLVAVIECGSVVEAARRLNLTAAGITQRVRALETEIGVSLMVRVGRNVRPTAAAVAILQRAKGIQRDVRDLKSIATSGLLSGELRLGVMPTMYQLGGSHAQQDVLFQLFADAAVKADCAGDVRLIVKRAGRDLSERVGYASAAHFAR